MAQQTQNLFTAVRTLKFRELSGDPKTFDIYDETDPSVTGVIECSMTNPEDKETLYLEIQYPKGIPYAKLENIGINNTTPTVIWRENAPKDKWYFLVEPKSSSNVALDSWLVKKKKGVFALKSIDGGKVQWEFSKSSHSWKFIDRELYPEGGGPCIPLVEFDKISSELKFGQKFHQPSPEKFGDYIVFATLCLYQDDYKNIMGLYNS